MRRLPIPLFIIALASSMLAQQQSTAGGSHAGLGATALSDGSNLPVERIGKDDLIGINVYDSPELTRTVRVGADGTIRLPMLRQHIPAAGLYPNELETAIATALITGNVLVDPIVTVSVVEYRSRPISVSGAVKKPITFQATGSVTLLDAIAQADGLADNAGADILVSKQQSVSSDKPSALVQRIPVKALMDGEDPQLNLHLEGGEDIRVPEAGRVFVLGRVKKPGAFYITDGSDSSVMKALALSEGLDSFPSHTAYIYRTDRGAGTRREIPIELKKILSRKSPDVPLLSNDILYVPDATGMRASMKTLETSLGLAAGLGSAAIIVTH